MTLNTWITKAAAACGSKPKTKAKPKAMPRVKLAAGYGSPGPEPDFLQTGRYRAADGYDRDSSGSLANPKEVWEAFPNMESKIRQYATLKGLVGSAGTGAVGGVLGTGIGALAGGRRGALKGLVRGSAAGYGAGLGSMLPMMLAPKQMVNTALDGNVGLMALLRALTATAGGVGGYYLGKKFGPKDDEKEKTPAKVATHLQAAKAAAGLMDRLKAVPGQVADFAKARPMLTGAVAGGLAGLVGTAFGDDEDEDGKKKPRNYFRNALLGGLAGGGAGWLANRAMGPSAEQVRRDYDSANDIGDGLYSIPQRLLPWRFEPKPKPKKTVGQVSNGGPATQPQPAARPTTQLVTQQVAQPTTSPVQ